MNEALGMLGILNRAKLLAFGPAVDGLFHKAKLVLLAEDASPRRKKEVLAAVNGKKIPLHLIQSKIELGRALGRDELSVVLVLDAKAAKSLLAKLQKGEQQ